MGQNASQSRGQPGSTTEGAPPSLKPPDDEPPENHIPRLSREVSFALISEGRVFTRYFITKTGKHCRSHVLVSYHKETKSICWCSPDTVRYDRLRSMELRDISHIVPGKHTPALLTSLATGASDAFCFSILSSKLHKSIDLEASDVTTAEAFARAIYYLKGKEAKSKQSKSKWSLPAPPYQMPITQASLSQILNASLIQSKRGLVPKVVPKGTRRSSSKKNTTPTTTLAQAVPRKKIVGRKRKTTKSSPLAGSSLSVSSSLPSIFALPDLPQSDSPISV